MIVQCPQCQAKFNLADEKISDKGLKVRCSKCKNVFEVKKEAKFPKEAEPQPKVSSEEQFNFSEDFDFSEEKISTERAPQPAPREDFSFSDEFSPPAPTKAEQKEKEMEDFSFEEEADFSSNEELETEQKIGDLGMSPEMPEIPSSSEEGISIGESSLEEELDDFKIDRGAEIPVHPPTVSTAPKKEESEEEFDFSAKVESYARPEMPARPKAETGDELEAKLDLDTEGPSLPTAPAATAMVREPKPQAPARPVAVPRIEEKRGGLKTFLIILLIIILLLPLGGLGYLHLTGSFKIPELFKKGGFTRLKEVPAVENLLVQLGLVQPAPKGQISVLTETISYQMINRREGGMIAVVSGKVRNEYPVPVEYIQVEVSLYDANKNLLASGLSYGDVRFTREELATQSIQWIQDYMDTTAGRYMKNQRVEPGEERDFAVVFFQIPPGVESYDVRIKSFGIIKSGG